MARFLASAPLLAAALALVATGCQSAADKRSEKLMPAVEAFVASIPTTDPKELVRTGVGWLDTLEQLDQKLAKDEINPPPGSPAALKLAPAKRWMEAVRAENAALEAAFKPVVASIEFEAQTDLASAVSGGAAKGPDDIAAALAKTTAKKLVLWHGAGGVRGFDEDHQRIPADRRPTDPGERFIVGYVQRVAGEGVTFVVEKVVAEQKVAYVALFDMPIGRRLGTFVIKGDTAQLPKPVPLAGTVIPGKKPAVVGKLLGSE
jgi:hypothetical protein